MSYFLYPICYILYLTQLWAEQYLQVLQEIKFPFIQAREAAGAVKVHRQVKLAALQRLLSWWDCLTQKPWAGPGLAPSALFSKGALMGTYPPALGQVML